MYKHYCDPNGAIHMVQSGQIYIFSNGTGDVTFAQQEFCFITPDVLIDNLLYIAERGDGWTKFDASVVFACNPCQPGDLDSDGDGLCDSNDPCPNSFTDDFDNDGVCDDIDTCLGFDDAIDSDGDGIPNGCDICPAGNDLVDSDSDGVPNACDHCPGSDDSIDSDLDGIPNDCDTTPCVNFITELNQSILLSNQSANYQVLTNGTARNNINLDYTAGQNLLFTNGFEVKPGSIFHAEIKPCSN